VPPPRRLKMMWDYMAFPLWAVVGDDGQPWSIDDLELSESLRRDLQRWSDDWTDAMLAGEGPTSPDWKPPPDDDRATWDRRGRDLLAKVRTEVGNAYEVGYFNEQTREVEWPERSH
jgi:hypothetical protein